MVKLIVKLLSILAAVRNILLYFLLTLSRVDVSDQDHRKTTEMSGKTDTIQRRLAPDLLHYTVCAIKPCFDQH